MRDGAHTPRLSRETDMAEECRLFGHFSVARSLPAAIMACEHILGPKLSGADPRLAVTASNEKPPSTLGVSGLRLPFYVAPADDSITVVVDRKASLVAADARKLVEAFETARRMLKQPRLQAVVLLGAEQRMCSKVDNPNRARPLLQAANVAVYRLPPKQDA